MERAAGGVGAGDGAGPRVGAVPQAGRELPGIAAKGGAK